MAFSYTKGKEIHIGGKRIVTGRYNCASVTGGDIQTGLAVVDGFILTPKGAAVATNQSVYNETLPLVNTGGTITIVTDSGQEGSWLAWQD